MEEESVFSEEFIPDFVVKPYQFEPVATSGQKGKSDESSSSESEDGQENDDVEHLPANLDWCECSNCSTMETARECKCCREIQEVARKIMDVAIKCITEHESFIVNCLNHHVLELSYYEYIQDNGPLGADEFIHELYRHIAYRRLARFIWRRLGRHNRRILPGCVVSAIRRQFLSQEYCGFRYPGEG